MQQLGLVHRKFVWARCQGCLNLIGCWVKVAQQTESSCWPGNGVTPDQDFTCCWICASGTCAGDVVAIYHYKEGETEKGPAIVGESALLAATDGQYRVRPCGYRYLVCNHSM